MHSSFRQSMAFLHTWVGLLLGWVLFFMFLMGTIAYFYKEIDRWMRPELPLVTSVPKVNVSMKQGLLYLKKNAPEKAVRWEIHSGIDRSSPYPTISWIFPKKEGKRRGKRVRALLDSATGEKINVTPRETAGGFTLYKMHFRLMYLDRTLSIYIVLIATMFMFLAIITGIIVHKKIFKDFFTFRPRKGQRSWLDGHNILSVLSLPFHIMITYSGFVFFAYSMMPYLGEGVYGEVKNNYRQELRVKHPPVIKTNIAAEMTDVMALVAQAQDRWGTEKIAYLRIDNPGDQNSRIYIRNIRQYLSKQNGAGEMLFDGVSGELLNVGALEQSTAMDIRGVMIALHRGQFAGPIVRWLYYFIGLAGTMMIATGLVLWTTKRRQKQELAGGGITFGLRFVEKLNVGTIAGLPVGVAAYFIANRFLPVEMLDRRLWEIDILFYSWLVMLLYPMIVEAKKAWVHELYFAAALFMSIPFINIFTTQRHLGITIPQGDVMLATMDITIFLTGLIFGRTAYKISRKKTVTVKKPRRTKKTPPKLEGGLAE